jgi:hypothetical protein
VRIQFIARRNREEVKNWRLNTEKKKEKKFLFRKEEIPLKNYLFSSVSSSLLLQAAKKFL